MFRCESLVDEEQHAVLEEGVPDVLLLGFGEAFEIDARDQRPAARSVPLNVHCRDST